MTSETLTRENYCHSVTTLFAQKDDFLWTTREEMQRQGLRTIDVSSSEGKLRHLLTLLLSSANVSLKLKIFVLTNFNNRGKTFGLC